MVELVARGLEAQQDLVLIFRALWSPKRVVGRLRAAARGGGGMSMCRGRGGGPTPPAAVAGWLGLCTAVWLCFIV